VIDSQGSALARTVGRALVSLVALGSLLVLLDAGAKYSGAPWHPAAVAREPSALEREVASPGFTPLEFRLSENLPLELAQAPCFRAGRADSASLRGDESLDINCAGGPTVKGVGDLPGAELLSWPSDWMYHRGLRF
jgi:hypothetical protein